MYLCVHAYILVVVVLGACNVGAHAACAAISGSAFWFLRCVSVGLGFRAHPMAGPRVKRMRTFCEGEPPRESGHRLGESEEEGDA